MDESELLTAALEVLEQFADRFPDGDEGMELAGSMQLDAQLQAARVVLEQAKEL